jgi:GT2 family glycosyltransferase
MSNPRQRVALVVPFFGRELRGRKERFAFSYATHLALAGVAIDVITTTARAEAVDANYYRSGIDNTEPFPVYRFKVVAPDRAAYAEAVLAVERDREAITTYGRALIDERLRSPALLAHVRAVAPRYDAFIFLDATAPTTVNAVGEVPENAILVPLIDDEPVARQMDVIDAITASRFVLCTTNAEAALVGDIAGPGVRRKIRVIGLAADTVPLSEIKLDSVRRSMRGRPYVLVAGSDENALAQIRASGRPVRVLEDADERDRAALFVCASLVAITGEGIGVAPEAVEAWSYGKAVVVAANSPTAALVHETGGGWIVPDRQSWQRVLAATSDAGDVAAAAARGAEYVEAQGGWPAVVLRTSDAIDALAALDDGRSRDALIAQIAYLYPLVQRQRRTIESMRVSRFWRLRDAWFAAKRRLGIGPPEDPVQFDTSEDRTAELAALGDPYQLFRENHRLRQEDVDRMRATERILPQPVTFEVLIDARNGSVDGLRGTLLSIREQIYERWTAKLIVPESFPAERRKELALLADDARITVVAHADSESGDVVLPVDVHDRLEPHALFEVALAFQGDADIVYSDEDRIDERGVTTQPWFKPDWSPETFLTRDYVGRLCAIRRSALERVGGVREVLATAQWYDAVLRVTEQSGRVAHVPQVLYHRHPGNAVDVRDAAIATEAALRRRGEDAAIVPLDDGVEVRFGMSGSERVSIIIPTRDRPELLEPCLRSIFERTDYPNFDVILVDNASRDERTFALIEQWQRREPKRFRVVKDPAPFNYSALNNAAVRSTDADFVVLLNNDTEIIAADWMRAMLGQARRAQVGAVGALLLYADDTVQHGGVVLGILGLAGHANRYLPGNGQGYHGNLTFDTNYLAVTGACLMIEKRKFEEVGGLDEELAVSYNDVDLCLRLRAAGYRNVFVPRARLYHYESKSRGGDDTPAKVARAMQEVGLIRTRWPDWSVRDPYYNPNLTVDAEDFALRI